MGQIVAVPFESNLKCSVQYHKVHTLWQNLIQRVIVSLYSFVVFWYNSLGSEKLITTTFHKILQMQKWPEIRLESQNSLFCHESELVV